MSRLIFEGDTRERFGELFPKPFIEEIRVFNTTIETDVAVYFEVPEGLTAVEFLEETGMDQLRVYIGPILGDAFEQAVSLDSGTAFLAGSILTDAIGGDAFSSYALLDYASSSEFFYNSNGDKFIKFLITDVTDNTYDFFSSIAIEKYIFATTIFPDNDYTNTDVASANADQQALYKNQTSAISYHKIFNSDGSLNTGRQIVYLESDGNYYSNIPLRGLDRIYRKVNLITHQQAQDLIQATIQSSIETLPEADLISETLQKFSNDPNLLLEIQKNINNFSNKSSATVIGTLYGQLVDVVVEIDNILTRSETVEKRLIFSSKILDRRSRVTGMLGEKIFVSPSPGDLYIDIPFFCRYLHRLNEPAVEPIEHYIIENFMYLLFDYEKALNYGTEISNFFNPYNIFQIFGKNCLNKYFKIDSAKVLKSRAIDIDQVSLGFAEIEATLSSKADNYSYVYNTEDTTKNIRQSETITDPTAATESTSAGDVSTTTIFSRIVERAFDTVEDLGDYRLRCHEVAFLETAINGTEDANRFYTAQIDIIDTTMQFFEEHIHQKLISLKEELNNYLLLAEQFCSYNNIDGRFNDFFNDNVRDEFAEPFVWEEAPKYFYAIIALIESSWENADTMGTRRTDGTLIDMEKIKQLATAKNYEINPRTGRLDLLRVFVEDFNNFVNSTIGYGAPWSDRIWIIDGDLSISNTLKLPEKLKIFVNHKQMSNLIVDEIEFSDPPGPTEDDPPPTGDTPPESPPPDTGGLSAPNTFAPSIPLEWGLDSDLIEKTDEEGSEFSGDGESRTIGVKMGGSQKRY
tara:strand:+ start:2750 stop:5155 length:2406 start_codon:yes stop_codon:yes gene_type:complete